MRPVVLLVDDDVEVMETFKRILHAEGFEVRSSLSTEDGLREATQRRPDVIILEMRMPSIDGLQFLERLRADPEQAATVVAILTGDYLVAEDEVAAAARLGASVHFKPLWLEDLVTLAHELLDSGPPVVESRAVLLAR
jgi:DNA-binding response OmpR family regulator